MGCFDLYCVVCGGPFTNYQSWNIAELKDIDTTWLKDAMLEYYKDGKKVREAQATDYDSYGRFIDFTTGQELDVVEDVYYKKVLVFHKACHGRPVPRVVPLLRYQEQHFDVDRLVADGNHNMLRKPE